MESQAAALEAQAQSIAAARGTALAAIRQQLANLQPKGRHPRPMTHDQQAKAAPLMAQSAALTAQLRQAQTVAATNVFTRREGRWRLVLHHGSGIAA